MPPNPVIPVFVSTKCRALKPTASFCLNKMHFKFKSIKHQHQVDAKKKLQDSIREIGELTFSAVLRNSWEKHVWFVKSGGLVLVSVCFGHHTQLPHLSNLIVLLYQRLNQTNVDITAFSFLLKCSKLYVSKRTEMTTVI